MNTPVRIDIEDSDDSSACDSFDKELYQVSRRSSLDGSHPQMQLITALLKNDYTRFEELANHDEVDLEYLYKQPDRKTCLEFAVTEANKEEYVKLILQHEVQLNYINGDSYAPIHLAALNGNIEALKVLLEDDRIDVNIVGLDNKTALLMVIDTMSHLDVDRRTIYEDILELLLRAGCNANLCDRHSVLPIYVAAYQGLKNVVKMIFDYAEEPEDNILLEPTSNETLLQATILGMGYEFKSPKADYIWCIDFFLNISKIDVNYPDVYENTAVYYAARNGDNATVLKLLRHGACVGLRNRFNVTPLAEINAKTLETYLDESITTETFFKHSPNEDNYEIRIKYGALAHTNNSLQNETLKVPLIENGKTMDAILAPETDALLYMSQNEQLCPLLKHPVITSFLCLKWQRISCLAYANITFYSLFWLCLILYVILGYSVQDSIQVLSIITHAGAVIGLILLIIRELFQLLLSPSRYVKSIGNLMEIALTFITAWILFYDSVHESAKKQLSAVAILISSVELLLLIGQFPASTANILMLKTVTWNFLKFLLWYCILIIAFALSFYTLFRHVVEDKTPPPLTLNNTEKEEDEDFFNDPFRALFKTIVMLTGEFDTGSIQFNSFPVTSHIIFIVFVFMIPIVLFNLLNGLAISDIQEIRADAELVGLIYRVKLISYFESILMGNANSNKSPTKCWSWVTTHLQDLNKFIKTICIKPLAKRICLYPHVLPDYSIGIKPNLDYNIWTPTNKRYGYYCRRVDAGNGCFRRCETYKLDGKIVQNAKIIIRKKRNITEFDEIKDTLVKNEIKIHRLDDMMSKYEKKMDSLETNINNVLQTLETILYTQSKMLESFEQSK